MSATATATSQLPAQPWDQGIPEGWRNNAPVNEDEINAILNHVMGRGRGNRTWIIFEAPDTHPGCKASLTPISKPDVTLQLTFWDATGAPVGDRPIKDLRTGVAEALSWGFTIPSVRHELEAQVDIGL